MFKLHLGLIGATVGLDV